MRRPTIAAAVLVVLVPISAEAHFRLTAPASVTVQDLTGNPQKTPPCGGAGTPSDMVTTVMTGSTLTVTLNETIFHPGHYRISIAQDQAGLPPPPVVTGANCGSAEINMTPALPVLADGVFVHTASFGGVPQTTQIQLPPGFTCDNCVVQILEFMSAHAPPCFYYHCATVTISDTAPPPADASPMPDAEPGGPDGPGGPGNNNVGGGCATGSATAGSALLGVLAALGLVLRRRRLGR